MTLKNLTAEQLAKAVLILGFDNEITLWERPEPQPTDEEIFAALHG